jgi:hypothetical protein
MFTQVLHTPMKLIRRNRLIHGSLLALGLIFSAPHALALQSERLDPAEFSGVYEPMDDQNSDVSRLEIEYDPLTATLHTWIRESRSWLRADKAFLPPMSGINREPQFTEKRVIGGCTRKQQVSATDKTRAFSQIEEIYLVFCKTRTRYKKLEYSIQRGTQPNEVVILWGAEAGSPANRLHLKRID